jgi:hypothetical protein
MIRGITIARKGEDFEVLITPETPFVEQRRNFRKLRTHLEGYDEVELWSSGRGRVKRYRFKPKVQAVTPPAPKAEDATTSPETPASVPSTSSPTELPPVVVETPSSPSEPKAKKAKKPSGKKKSK